MDDKKDDIQTPHKENESDFCICPQQDKTTVEEYDEEKEEDSLNVESSQHPQLWWGFVCWGNRGEPQSLPHRNDEDYKGNKPGVHIHGAVRSNLQKSRTFDA